MGRKFTFGKYKGQLIVEVIRMNPNYIDWCKENIPYFTLTDNEKSILELVKGERMEYNETPMLMKKYGMHVTEAQNFIEYSYPEYW